MGLYNVNDSPLEWLIEAVQGLIRENPFESAAITDGRVRFIGGLLLLQAGARLTGEGTFDWTGPGSIAGDWEVLDGGVIRVGAVLISPVGGGRIMIGQGPVGIILDGGTGTLTMGNIRMEGGKIYAGTGANQVVIDGATGKVTLTSGLEVDEGGYIQVGPTRISGAVEGLITSLLEIAVKTPLFRIVGALRVTQAAVFDGSVSMPGLIPISPEDASPHKPGAIIRDSSNRLRIVTN
ncbi:hypothetical protein [Microbacterium testaceum]|uniref:Uncharacterized protein n=1 Tax=Microbacterium testaceum TaxID=2033 RepID=A0A147F4M9_MICTE|nr:hypothetical protein [Microbacterium testaceum]KTS09033.1 hypothetical protein RSA3_14110 [Microbacterium testaceum]